MEELLEDLLLHFKLNELEDTFMVPPQVQDMRFLLHRDERCNGSWPRVNLVLSK